MYNPRKNIVFVANNVDYNKMQQVEQKITEVIDLIDTSAGMIPIDTVVYEGLEELSETLFYARQKWDTKRFKGNINNVTIK